jgi:alpha-glucosidase
VAALKWWQTSVFYQIYPRSFADGNGDGIGDFKGITEKLDYLSDLGVEAIGLSPDFPSANWDCGYEISDDTDVAPGYGTLEDFKGFLHKAQARNMRVILNFSGNKLELDFSKVRQIRGHDLQILFSSAEHLKTAKPPSGLTINPFEVFIAEVQRS